MKRLALLFSFTMVICISAYAQQQVQAPSFLWKIFCSGSIDFVTFETSAIKQDHIDVKQEGNKYYWGNDNVYTIYNKKEDHNGFVTYTTCDFIDKYNQRGNIIYQYNRDSDWTTKHMFYIQYEGIRMGKYYCSNEPQKL